MSTRRSALTGAVTRAMGVFGGVQMVSIACSVVRAKLIAILIGPLGVGLMAIYLGALDLMQNLTQLNMRQSAVRDLAANGNPLTISAVRFCGRWLGWIGFVLMVALSPLLSLWTFGDASRWYGFALTALALPFLGVNSAQLAILQGLKRLSALARTTAWAAVVTIIASVPLFFWLRQHSIIPVIVLGAIVAWVCSWRQSRTVPSTPVSAAQAVRASRAFLALGFYITITTVLNQLAAYALISFLNDGYDTDTVGFFRAGYTLVNSYVGIVFTAIGMEYYPRLSSIIQHRRHVQTIVSHEISLSLWALMPIICVFVAADTLIVRLLYSSAFEVITPYITWAMVGVALKAPAWCMAFVILARGNGRVFVITEGISEALYLALSIVGFTQYGWAGLGWAYAVWYAIYLAIIAIVYYRHYGLRLGRGIVVLVLLAFAVSVAAVVLRDFVGWWAPLLMGVCLLPMAWRRLTGRKSFCPSR